MFVQTQLLDFIVSPIKGEIELNEYHEKIFKLFDSYIHNLKLLQEFKIGESSLKLYTNNNDVLLSIRVFNRGMIDVNIEYEPEKQIISFDEAEKLEKLIVKSLDDVERSQTICPIRRGEPRYLRSSDQRIFEYDIDEVLFEKQTQFQKVQILHSKTFGNMLVLDGYQNLAESDIIYTESLMHKGNEKYENKEILILGGGDGALLYEILKEKPKFVTMIEIDLEVMLGCNKYMKSVCGDVLDKMKGDNFEIIVDDCVKYMEEYVKNGKQFDYIFGDLTDIPISQNSNCEIWDFINKILYLSFKILKPDGKYLSHGNGVSCQEALELYEKQLKKINPGVTWKKSTAFVPSFMEEWVFYNVTFS